MAHAPLRTCYIRGAEVNTLFVESVNRYPVSTLLIQALKYFRAAGYDLLPVTAAHATAVERLKPRHADPFDRMLVAQALSEPFVLLTHDKQVADYDKAIILV